jgi:coatomer subunit gamma
MPIWLLWAGALHVSALIMLRARMLRHSQRLCTLQIKYIARVLKDTTAPVGNEKRPFYDYLHASLRHKSDMVMFQAARTIAELKDVTMAELTPAISCLQLFLNSGKSVLRFAAVRILNSVSMRQPIAVTNCNTELETLITDSNRSIAVYAITTLLKTGSEASVDRVLKQIRTFMTDIPDDFKVVVVDAIRSLCLKFPNKNRALLNFLSHMLREEGGYEFKKAIVEALLVLINAIPEAREPGLLHLAEFIEDCEFTQLATQVPPTSGCSRTRSCILRRATHAANPL